MRKLTPFHLFLFASVLCTAAWFVPDQTASPDKNVHNKNADTVELPELEAEPSMPIIAEPASDVKEPEVKPLEDNKEVSAEAEKPTVDTAEQADKVDVREKLEDVSAPVMQELTFGEKHKYAKQLNALVHGASYIDKSAAKDELLKIGVDAAKEAMPLLKHDDHIVRILTIIIMRETACTDAYPQLVEMLQDSSSKIRFHAGIAMVKMTGEDVGYHFTGTEQTRAAAIKKWQAIIAKEDPAKKKSRKEIKKPEKKKEAVKEVIKEEIKKPEAKVEKPQARKPITKNLSYWKSKNSRRVAR